jgi:nucleoid-associated protein YgaU
MAKQKGLKNLLKYFRTNESRISTILGLIIIVAAAVLAFNYFRGVNREQGAQPTPTPTPAEGEVKLTPDAQGNLVPEGLPTTYAVVAGDNLWKIAVKYYTSGYNWVDIAKENKLANPGLIYVGQELNIPKTAVIEVKQTQATATPAESITGDKYTVQKGDNLWKIAVRAYGDGYKWVDIAKANDLKNPGLIHSGNELTLPR